jgi:hypothetical protein
MIPSGWLRIEEMAADARRAGYQELSDAISELRACHHLSG